VNVSMTNHHPSTQWNSDAHCTKPRKRKYPLVRWVDRWLDRTVRVTSALFAIQIPHFIQQYSQCLGGFILHAEKQWNGYVNDVEGGKVPRCQGISIWDCIEVYKNSEDPYPGSIFEKTYNDIKIFKEAERALDEASLWWRPTVFSRYCRYDITKKTWEKFISGGLINCETMIYALAGFVFGACVYTTVSRGLPGIGRLIGRKIKQLMPKPHLTCDVAFEV